MSKELKSISYTLQFLLVGLGLVIGLLLGGHLKEAKTESSIVDLEKEVEEQRYLSDKWVAIADNQQEEIHALKRMINVMREEKSVLLKAIGIKTEGQIMGGDIYYVKLEKVGDERGSD